MSATAWDVLFCLLVALEADVPEHVTAHPDYRDAWARFCDRQQIDGFPCSLWWLDRTGEIYQPSTVSRVWKESLAWPDKDDGWRFGWTPGRCSEEEDWAKAELDRLLLLAEMESPWRRSAYEPWIEHARQSAGAFADLRESMLEGDSWRGSYLRRCWLMSLRDRIGPDNYARGVMPSRVKPD